MSSEIKGSESERLMTVEEAAQTLQCTTKSVYNMAKKGLLKTIYVKTESGRSVAHFRALDVFAAVSARFEGLDVAKAGNLAMRALALSEHNQSMIQALLDILGFHQPSIPFDEAGVAALQEEAKERLEATLPASDQEILRWSRVLMQISEEYLELAKTVTGDPEPWKVFTFLGERLAEDLQESCGATQDKIKAFLSGARKHFRNTAYFYVRTRDGSAFADDKVSRSERLDDAIINLMFLH